MTAHAIKGDREHCLQAGMDGYVSKPIEAGDLYRAIADVAPKMTAGVIDPEGLPEAMPFPMASRVCCRIGMHCSSDSEAVGIRSRRSWPCFKTRFRDRWPRSGAAIDRGDATRIERTAHSLKGAIGVFGESAAYHAAQSLESMSYAGDLTEIGDVYHSLEKLVHELELALAEIVPRSNDR